MRLTTLEPENAWGGAQAAFVRAAGADCRQAAGADHVRDFRLEATYEDLNWTLLLLPAYVAWYREGDQVWPILINGQSGRVSGARRGSARKANTTSLVLGGSAANIVPTATSTATIAAVVAFFISILLFGFQVSGVRCQYRS